MEIEAPQMKGKEQNVLFNNLEEKINFKNYFVNKKLRKFNIEPKILNRRYRKLEKLIEEDDYFSEQQIKLREPLLYFLYCGQYLRDGDAKELGVLNLMTSEFLQERLIDDEYQKILKKHYENLKNKEYFPKLDSVSQIPQEELEDNQDELIRLLHDKFVSGGDTQQFNYEEIDQDTNLDNEKEMDNDCEENYFDNQDELVQNSENSQYTGIQDF